VSFELPHDVAFARKRDQSAVGEWSTDLCI
jgi:hypothetical protein